MTGGADDSSSVSFPSAFTGNSGGGVALASLDGLVTGAGETAFSAGASVASLLGLGEALAFTVEDFFDVGERGGASSNSFLRDRDDGAC